MNKFTANASSPVQSTDIEIKIWPRCWVHWYGTKSQLIAEGLVSEDFVFPAKYTEVSFGRDGFDFRLRRQCPRTLKGSRHLHPEVDWWCIATIPVKRSKISSGVYERQQQLAKQIFLESPAGQAQFFRHLNAQSDTVFQAFLTISAGIVSKRRSA